MSIRIFNGLKFNRTFTLQNIGAASRQWRSLLDQHSEETITAFMARNAVHFHDDAFFGMQTEDKELSVTNYSSGFSLAKQRLDKNREADADSFLPLKFEVVLMPIEADYTLATYYGNRDTAKLFIQHSEASDYSFWDNVDEPEDMSETEWTQREKDWKAALGDQMDLTPAEAGVSLSLISHQYASWWVPESESMADYLKSHDEEINPHSRATRLATHLLEKELYEQLVAYCLPGTATVTTQATSMSISTLAPASGTLIQLLMDHYHSQTGPDIVPRLQPRHAEPGSEESISSAMTLYRLLERYKKTPLFESWTHQLSAIIEPQLPIMTSDQLVEKLSSFKEAPARKLALLEYLQLELVTPASSIEPDKNPKHRI